MATRDELVQLADIVVELGDSVLVPMTVHKDVSGISEEILAIYDTGLGKGTWAIINLDKFPK